MNQLLTDQRRVKRDTAASLVGSGAAHIAAKNHFIISVVVIIFSFESLSLIENCSALTFVFEFARKASVKCSWVGCFIERGI